MEKYEHEVGGIVGHNIRVDSARLEMSYSDIECMYRKMLCMRWLDEGAESLYSKGLVRGFCHLDIGQEGVYGALSHVTKGDKLICSYRCHAMAVAAGISVEEIMAELLGKKGGVSKGKGGSMHLYNDVLYGGHGIVGAQVPLGCGMAYALKYKAGLGETSEACSNRVVFCFYGDGASNQGQVHESFNMAKIWCLPIVFVVVNNMYGMWTPVADVCANDEFYKRSDFLPGIRVQGHDVFSVVRCLEFARGHALKEGPVILQIDAYRFCGHSTTDSVLYRSESEVRSEMERDALLQVEAVLRTHFGTGHVEGIRNEVASLVRSEIEKALLMEEPDESELFRDINDK